MLTHCRLAQCNHCNCPLQGSPTGSIIHYAQLYSISCIQDSFKFLILIDWAGTYSEQFHKNHIIADFAWRMKQHPTISPSMLFNPITNSKYLNWTLCCSVWLSTVSRSQLHIWGMQTLCACRRWLLCAGAQQVVCAMALALTIHTIGGPFLNQWAILC